MATDSVHKHEHPRHPGMHWNSTVLSTPQEQGAWDWRDRASHRRLSRQLQLCYGLPGLPSDRVYVPGSRYTPWDEHVVGVAAWQEGESPLPRLTGVKWRDLTTAAGRAGLRRDVTRLYR